MASWDSSRIAIPFVPSLQHLSSVKMAIRLFNQFDVQMLDTAFTEIKQKNGTTCDDTTVENRKKNRAKEVLHSIPAHLRETVVRAVRGLRRVAEDWRKKHSHFFKYGEGMGLYCRSDGSIDTLKTARNLVLDVKISMQKRFKIACMYCFEQSVRTLWEKMVASGIADSFDNTDHSLVRFWVRWLREATTVPWTLAAQSYLDRPSHASIFFYAKLSAFLPLLPLEDRPNVFHLLQYTSCDDLRFCLCALTKEEEEILLKGDVTFLLVLYLSWPLQTLFVETAEKLWSYIDQESFCSLLFYTLQLNDKWNDFNYSEILEYLWKRSSNHWREIARKIPLLRERIDSYFGSKKLK